ncbi:uracil phosphoribosyltransferase [Streptomyces sp. NBC_01716]|uniref:uracil phosphoribosyltransferase n=1 Tax=Streptomyces sp. NBC_01716 TaxID=2975917 RepID=UPI002E379C1A|nr:uracil phosphoribosyltransferase [Streptomyces sp. NBC_01716]
MTFAAEAPDDEKRYARLQHTTDPGEARHGLIGIGGVLGLRTAEIMRAELGALRDVLCVFVLRGGALMYPGFATAFPQADFCVLGMRRTADRLRVDHQYMTDVPRGSYQATVYIDCVAATGGTLLAAREAITARCDTGHEVAAVVSSAAAATDRVRATGISFVGFSLYEDLDGQVVTPDMGELDAGDLFSGVSWPSVPDGSER